MNSTDTANLLIALCGCDAPGEAPLAINRFRGLRSMIGGNADVIRRYVESIDQLPGTLWDMTNCQCAPVMRVKSASDQNRHRTET